MAEVVGTPEEWFKACQHTAAELLNHLEGWLEETEARPETVALVLFLLRDLVDARASGLLDAVAEASSFDIVEFMSQITDDQS